jgi:hypothetical protein
MSSTFNIEWFVTSSHSIRFDQLSSYLEFVGSKLETIYTKTNPMDSNNFPNENIINCEFSTKENFKFSGYFRDMSKFDSNLQPVAKFTLLD